MSFFSKALKTVFGGSDSKSESSSRAGFDLLPPELQEAFTGFSGDLSSRFRGGRADDLFTPLPQTRFEDQALSSIGQGLTPTEDTLRSDIGMQMNPFDDFVIDAINRESQGENSILNQALNQAGQVGSNRGILGASDIEQQRLGTIGRFRQDQYNTALQNTLNRLPQLRSQDIGLQLGAGEFLRGLDTQTRQAPIQALSSFGDLLGALPQSGGSISSSRGRSDVKPSIFKQVTDSAPSLGEVGGAAGGIASAFSDRRLKENIEFVGIKNGHNIYEYNYINKIDPRTRFRGVMADEVEKISPNAVLERDIDVKGLKGTFKSVNYNMLGLKLEVVS